MSLLTLYWFLKHPSLDMSLLIFILSVNPTPLEMILWTSTLSFETSSL